MNQGDTSPLQIKAHRDGFILSPDPSASFELIKTHLEKRLSEGNEFFRRSKMALDLRGRPFRAEEVYDIRDMLHEKAGVELTEVRLGTRRQSFFEWASRQLGVTVTCDSLQEQEPCAVVVRHTCRSGTRIESPSDCLILGDVNPGAELIAAGDIIVFGVLRGMAHAGAWGDRSARIWALSIQPNQIRIADLVAVPPQEDKSQAQRFEVAEVQSGYIQVTTTK